MSNQSKQNNEQISDLTAILEAAKDGKIPEDVSIELLLEKTVKCVISWDEDELNRLSLEELHTKLDDAECELVDLEDEEPDEKDEEAHAEWEEQCDNLEDLIDELEDRISDLECEKDDDAE
ncbi:MAG: hypothetical protein J6X61_02535 [Clostridia bacterium]|nr:hypothetical protein [Clostridia bacterium]